MTEKPIKYDRITNNKPYTRLGKNISTGIANPKESIVVVEGKEQLLACHTPIILTLEITMNGRGLSKNSFINEPIPYETGPVMKEINPQTFNLLFLEKENFTKVKK